MNDNGVLGSLMSGNEHNFSTLNKLKARQLSGSRAPGRSTRINCGDPGLTQARALIGREWSRDLDTGFWLADPRPGAGTNANNKPGNGEDLNKTKTQSTQEREIDEDEPWPGHTHQPHYAGLLSEFFGSSAPLNRRRETRDNFSFQEETFNGY